MSAIGSYTSKTEAPPTPPHVLKGPADADHYRVKHGRFYERWYTDPLPACDIARAVDEDNAVWPSVSTVKKATGQDWTFIGLKRVAQALEDKPGCLDGLDFDDRYAALKRINEKSLRQAQNRGTNVHWYMECGLRGLPIEPRRAGEEGIEYLPAIRSWFATYQPKLVAAEIVFIHRNLNGVGYGGTGDGIVEIDGKLYMLDWKSRGTDSDHGAYPEEAAQIAAYAGAQYMIVEGEDGPERRRVPELDGGLIVSIKPDGMREYPINLTAAWDHYAHLHSWWVARRDERAAIGRPWSPRKQVVVEPTSSTVSSTSSTKTPTQIAEEIRRVAAQAHIEEHESASAEIFAAIEAATTPEQLVEIWREHQKFWNPEHTAAASARKQALSGVTAAA